MNQDDGKHDAEPAATTNGWEKDESSKGSSSSDRDIVIDAFKEFVQAGNATLEDTPDSDSQLLRLPSGETFWLGPWDIKRID